LNRHDDGHHVVVPVRASDPDDGDVGHRLMMEDLALHLECRDVFAAATDRVLDAVDVEIVAFRIAAKRIAGVEPAVSPGPRGGFRIVEIADGESPRRVRPHDELADPAVFHLYVVVVDDPGLDPVARPAAAAHDGGI